MSGDTTNKARVDALRALIKAECADAIEDVEEMNYLDFMLFEEQKLTANAYSELGDAAARELAGQEDDA